PDYFAGVNEIAEDGTVLNINFGNHVNNMIFPWECEIQKMCNDNGISAANIDDYQIVFAPVVVYAPSVHAPIIPLSNVNWPHVVILHLSHKITGDLLDNVRDLTYKQFTMRGANF